MGTFQVATALAAFIFLVGVRPVTAEKYVNEEFGLRVVFPDDLVFCSGAAGEHDHGITIFLDPGTVKDCSVESEYDDRRFIDVFAFYNALDDIKGLHGLLRWSCEDASKSRCLPPPKGLRLGHWHSLSARANLRGDRVEIVVVTQAGRNPQVPYAPMPLVNYVVSLYTTEAHRKEDLRSFRRFLNNIRLTPPH